MSILRSVSLNYPTSIREGFKPLTSQPLKKLEVLSTQLSGVDWCLEFWLLDMIHYFLLAVHFLGCNLLGLYNFQGIKIEDHTPKRLPTTPLSKDQFFPSFFLPTLVLL